jgi:hypothetical protein
VKGKERKPKIYGTVVESERWGGGGGGILLGFGLAWVQGNLWEVGMEDDVVGVSLGGERKRGVEWTCSPRLQKTRLKVCNVVVGFFCLKFRFGLLFYWRG